MKATAVIHLVSSLKKSSWKSVWAGEWTLLSCSDWGEFFTRDLKIIGMPFVSKAIFIFRDSKVNCWWPEKEINGVSKRLAMHVGEDVRKIKSITSGLCTNVDMALDFMKRNNPARLTLAMYEKYLRTVRQYYTFHIQVKYIVDGLGVPVLKKFLPILEKSRIYAEPVFDATLDFDRKIATHIAKKTGRNVADILFMTKDEVKKYFTTGKVSPIRELGSRRRLSALVYEKGRQQILVGKEAQLVESALTARSKEGVLKGATAYSGKAVGIVRIIFDPHKVKIFNKMDILVTGMTRPEFLPLMKKSGAFVTDAGGVLSHAAIVARELKKPCVIGTKIATKIFKDGDRVEVDATRGIVRKI